MGFLSSIWNFFATYILRQAPYMIGFITLIGYALMKKKWYDVLSGTLKAIIGMLILKRFIDEKHLWIASVFGAVLHNTGQMAAALLLP